jgi:diguanylate cyclase (GGDEF)-like protein
LSSLRKEFYTTVLLGVILAIAVLIVLYNFINKTVIEEKLESARLQAKTIVAYRHYLSLVAPKVKILDNNLSPFAITPAYATNQVAKILRNDHIYIKQVSDVYRNPADKPNNIELAAIEYFKKHKNKQEVYTTHDADENFNQKYLFYARKLVIEKSCLKCHGVPYKDVSADLYKKIVKIYGNKAFGYKLGEVRGIVSIIMPYEKVIYQVRKIFGVILLVGVIFFIAGVIIFLKVNEKIQNDINKILEHFKLTMGGKYPILKEKMDFVEFQELKNQINKTFFKLKKYQGTVYHRYYFHPLTNLPNRNKFLEVINEKKYPIVLINTDKFKEINFYFGNEIADKLIQHIANRLKELRKKYNFNLYHIDIDEFALIFKNEKISKEELNQIVKKIIKILEEPYNIDSNEIIVRFRAGVSLLKKDYIRADIALDMAKELKKDIFFGKDVGNTDKYKEHLQWLKKIQCALKNDKIVPFYQPIVDKNKNIIKYEALVRLIDEDGKVISPFLFLEVAKKSRLYLEITQRIINKAVEKILKKNISVSINLTLEDIEEKYMREFIMNKLLLLNDKSKITFEIVESEDVRENELVKKFLNKIKSTGALIYIDDFGSGYANFDYLIKLRPDGVKIDGSLIKNILEDRNSQIIVKTIVSFAKEMNIKTIAEFVENEEIFEYLKNLGVDYFQGYYFSPPKPDI